MQNTSLKRSLFLILLAFVLVLFQKDVSAHGKISPSEAPSFRKVRHFIENEPTLQGAAVGISVRSAHSGELLFEYNGESRLRPASNMKLLTAAAALSKLGKNHHFTTELWIDGSLEEKTLNGNIYLRGKGDPTLQKEDLQQLAKKVKEYSIEKVEGRLIGDDSWYDQIRYSPDMIWSDEDAYYGSQVSALTISPNQDYDAGTALIEISPGQAIGEPAKVTVFPEKTDYITLRNNLHTVSPDSSAEIKVNREHGKNIINIEGTIPLSSKSHKKLFSVWEPAEWTIHLFKEVLREEGINVSGSVTIGAVPKEARRIASRTSIPLSEMLKPFLMLSNNNHADILVKEIGKIYSGEGSFEKGLEVLETEIKRLGFNTEKSLIRDGSGISHLTAIPANEISNFLFHIQKEPWFPAFYEALPEAGNSNRLGGGTLRRRFNDTPIAGKVRAKTGTLTSVTSISGYMTAKSGEKLIFSILFNHLLDEEHGKRIEDEIISILWEL